MDEPIDHEGPRTPEEYEMMRQIGIGAKMLELWTERDQPDYAARAQEFERGIKAVDLVTGLLYAGEFLGRAHGDDRYMNTLRSWQLSAELAEAIRPVAEEQDGA